MLYDNRPHKFVVTEMVVYCGDQMKRIQVPDQTVKLAAIPRSALNAEELARLQAAKPDPRRG